MVGPTVEVSLAGDSLSMAAVTVVVIGVVIDAAMMEVADVVSPLADSDMVSVAIASVVLLLVGLVAVVVVALIVALNVHSLATVVESMLLREELPHFHWSIYAALVATGLFDLAIALDAMLMACQ